MYLLGFSYGWKGRFVVSEEIKHFTKDIKPTRYKAFPIFGKAFFVLACAGESYYSESPYSRKNKVQFRHFLQGLRLRKQLLQRLKMFPGFALYLQEKEVSGVEWNSLQEVNESLKE